MWHRDAEVLVAVHAGTVRGYIATTLSPAIVEFAAAPGDTAVALSLLDAVRTRIAPDAQVLIRVPRDDTLESALQATFDIVGHRDDTTAMVRPARSDRVPRAAYGSAHHFSGDYL